MSGAKPLASLSLDLDNKWSYMKTRGLAGWEALPSYLELLLPRVLRFLQQRGLTISVMVVGQDAVLDRHQDVLKALAEAGHEIGNHSFHHEPWLQSYSEESIQAELDRAHQAIQRATGRRPIGFRGPGFTLSSFMVRALAERGYLYDASTLPTFIGPLARAYYFFSSSLTPEERSRRRALYGTLRDGLRPLSAYRWTLPGGEGLLEIPVTTMPFLRVPIHVSYVLYLGTCSERLALAYFKSALALCRWSGTRPSLLLHPLDFLGSDEVPELAFFPAMGMKSDRKMALVDRILEAYMERFEVVTLERHARAVLAEAAVPCVAAESLDRASAPQGAGAGAA